MYSIRTCIKCKVSINMFFPLPGHSPRKQSTVSNHSPLHSEPPYEGPLHSLVRCVVPLEQEDEQELQLDHSFHSPSTKNCQGRKFAKHKKTQEVCVSLRFGSTVVHHLLIAIFVFDVLMLLEEPFLVA